MIDDTDSLRALEGAIERLSPDARASLEHWIYLNLSRPEEVLADRVVESAARYESPFLSFETNRLERYDIGRNRKGIPNGRLI